MYRLFLYLRFAFEKSFAIRYERKKDKAQEINIYISIFAICHISAELQPPKTRPAPSNEEISAWLSLDGIPKSQAINPKIMTVAKQDIHITLPSALLEKSTNEKTLWVTLAPRSEKVNTPKRLKIAESKALFPRLAVFDATSENIAFGASVQPLMKTTNMDSEKAKKASGVSKFDQKMQITAL